MATTAVIDPPEQGQLVNVRQRQWVVGEVAKGTLTDGPLQPLSGPVERRPEFPSPDN